jgi:hypothetical protein
MRCGDKANVRSWQARLLAPRDKIKAQIRIIKKSDERFGKFVG